MRVSEYYNLGETQSTLDFVDVDVVKDLKAFIDPHALRTTENDFTDKCVSSIQDYFAELLDVASRADDVAAYAILRPLKEPNETHLGLSKGRSRGRCLGSYLVQKIWERFKKSKAVATKLIEDLEDTLLFIDKIGPDLISDITTNIIRNHLIEYTQEMCETYGIPTVNVDSGPLWNVRTKEWERKYVKLPVTKSGSKLLLVPKSIVRVGLEFDAGEYYRHFLIEKLQELEFQAGTELVRIIKTKRGIEKKPPYKKDVEKKYGHGKDVILEQTLKNKDVLRDYRSSKETEKNPPLSHEELAATTSTPPVDLDVLLKAVLSVSEGNEGAHDYEKAIRALLSALFYPDLTYPKIHHPINDGRKVIDITFTNSAIGPFFGWLPKHNFTCPKIIIECKNYTDKVGNKELDQLAGRFAPHRGKVGLLVARRFDNKARFLSGCRDTALEGRGFIIALDDDDLKLLVTQVKKNPGSADFPLLRERFDKLVM